MKSVFCSFQVRHTTILRCTKHHQTLPGKDASGCFRKVSYQASVKFAGRKQVQGTCVSSERNWSPSAHWISRLHEPMPLPRLGLSRQLGCNILQKCVYLQEHMGLCVVVIMSCAIMCPWGALVGCRFRWLVAADLCCFKRLLLVHAAHHVATTQVPMLQVRSTMRCPGAAWGQERW